MIYGRAILVACVLALAVFIAGAQQFAHNIRSAAAVAPAELEALGENGDLAVVVVTGSPGRIEAGFRLMLDHDASRMLISGTGDGVSKDDIMRIVAKGQSFDRAILAERLDCCVDLGRKAVNTKGNASEATAWARTNGLDRMILVTADFHMPRTLIEFGRLMPDAQVLPFPVPTRSLGLDQTGATQWWQSRDRILTVALEYGKYLASLAG